MTSDMAGAAAVIATVIAAATLRAADRGDRVRRAGREPAVGHLVPAR